MTDNESDQELVRLFKKKYKYFIKEVKQKGNKR